MNTAQQDSPLAAPTRVDLRSDTVTLPTPAMHDRMARCPLGDDGLDGDPTAQELEAVAAELLGKEAGLYVPTCTMANLIAVLAQAGRQERVLCEASAHMIIAEQGGAALTGAFYQGLAGSGGAMDTGLLADVLEPSRNKLRVGLVCMETSHNNAGGTALPPEHMRQVFELSRAAGAKVHLDGARLFNAAVALGVEAASLARHADTVAICLSKGLSAPMGALLLGSHETMARARQLRKMLGGTQRQVGIAAAAGLVALTTMAQRLGDDHQTAQALARGLGALPRIATNTPQTNIVQADVSATGLTAVQWVAALQQQGVLVRPWGSHRLRCVTHRHLGEADIHRAVQAFGTVAAFT